MPAVGLTFDLLARDKASPAFGRLAGTVDKAALSTERYSKSNLEASRTAARLRVAELEVAAATERHATVAKSASASIAAQARAEAGLIRANQGLAEAQAASAVAAGKSTKAHIAGQRAATAGAAINRRLTLPLVALGAVSVNEAAKYQKSMTLIGTVTDQTQQQMAGTSKGLLQVAKDTGSGLHDLGEGLYTVEKGGFRGAKALQITKAAAQGAKAENTDLATTTNALTSIMASYGHTLSDPVAAMNMMIKASGLSKTTMQDFAGSLSNVVPVASSLGIGFDQVGGAIATMTQHGESAQHATDNLRNLITNLAGQNNVASQSLQQLGVNTIDLSKNLGKRGLTGSLDIVLAAINRHGKDGQIVTSAFKEAATATASVKTELNAMPKTLQANSRAFAAGKMDYKDYLAYAKSLGGSQFSMAKDFLNTQRQASGFNNQLKSGNSTVRTLASTLQKSLGGVTGMNVALQLSGESAHRFHEYVKEIGDSAGKTKGDVLGWANTQGTLAVKVDKAKAALQVMAVELGSAVIPAASKAVDWIGRGVHSFDDLSSTQKRVVGWSVGTLAAFGPLLSLGSRLTGVGEKIGSFATSVSGSSRTASRAVSGLGTALAAGAIGTSIGMLTQNSSTAVKAIGAIGSTATGALIGFGAGGPIGAAIGGGVGLLSNLATGLFGAGNAAKTNASSIDTFTEAIKRDNDALGANVRSLVASDLNKKGAGGKTGFDFARKLGIEPKTLTDAVLGVKGAKDKINAILAQKDGVALGIRDPKHPDQAAAWSRVTDQNRKILGVPSSDFGKELTGDQIKKLKAYADAADSVRDAIGDESNAVKDGKKAAADYAAATSVAGKNDTARAKALKAITAEQKQGAQAAAALTTQVAVHGTSLNPDADGVSNTAALSKVLKTYQGIEKAQVMAGTSAEAAGKNFETSTSALRDQATALGFNGKQVDALSAKYRLTPKQVVTAMVANVDKATASAGQLQNTLDAVKQNKIPGLKADSKQAQAVITALQRRIDQLQQKHKPTLRTNAQPLFDAVSHATQTLANLTNTPWLVGVSANTSPAAAAVDSLINRLSGRSITVPMYVKTVKVPGGGGVAKTPHGGTVVTGGKKAVGGVIRGPGTGTSDSVLMYGSNGEFVTREAMTRKHRGLLEAINQDKIPAFAKGGVVSKVKGGWSYGGKFYATEAGAKHARDRAAFEAKKDDKPARPASGVYRVAGGYGFEGQYYDHAKDANAARRDSRRQNAAAGRYQYTADYNTYRGAITSGDVDATKSAYEALMKDARGAGASKRALDALARSERAVVAQLQKRATITEQVSKATDYLNDLQSKANDTRTSVRGAFSGTFDLASASPTLFNDRPGGGSADAILKSVTDKANKATAFGALLQTLGKEGLSPTLLNQLAAAGPTPEAMNAAQALAASTPAKIGQINAQYKRLDAAGDAAGKLTANALFGSQIAVAKALISGYSTKNPAMAKAVQQLATSLFGAGKVSGQGLEKGLLGQKKAAGDAGYALGREVDRGLRKSLKIKSPSRVTWDIGTNAGSTLASALWSQHGAVSAASSALGMAAAPVVGPASVPTAGVPSPAPSGGTSGGDTYNDNRQYYEFHEVSDIGAIEMRIARRAARRGP